MSMIIVENDKNGTRYALQQLDELDRRILLEALENLNNKLRGESAFSRKQNAAFRLKEILKQRKNI